MNNKARRRLVSLVALFLVLSIVLGLVTAAFAAEPGKLNLTDVNADGKVQYVSVGASNAAGYGLQGYLTDAEVSGVLVGELSLGKAPLDGFGRSPEAAYPAQIAAYLKNQNPEATVAHTALSVSKLRAEEVRLLLDDSYAGDAYTAMNFTQARLSEVKTAYADALKQADVITLDLGWNNFGTYVCDNLAQYLKTGAGIYDKDLTLILGAENKAAAEQILSGIRKEIDPLLEDLTDEQIQFVSETFAYALVGYIVNFDMILGKIQQINPKAQVAVLGIRNQLHGVAVEDKAYGQLPLDQMYGEVVNMANVYMQSYSPYREKYVFTMTGEDNYVPTFLDEAAAYTGDPKTLSASVKDFFQVYASELKLKDTLIQKMGELCAEELKAVNLDAATLVAKGEAGKLEDSAAKALYEKYVAALDAAYDAGAQIVRYIAKDCSCVSTAGISGDIAAAEKKLAEYFSQNILGAASASLEGKTFALDVSAFADPTFELVAVTLIRGYYGGSFFGHPTGEGHQQIARDVIQAASGSAKGASLVLLEDALKQILDTISCEKTGHSVTGTWTWAEDFATATVTGTCLRCSATETQNVSQADQSITVEKVDATCADAGKITYTAKSKVLGKDLTDKQETSVAEKPHTLEEVKAVEATCAKPGNKAHFVCSVCGAMFQNAEGKNPLKAEDVVITVAHELKAVEAVKATCAQPGHKAHFVCAVCGKQFLDEEGKTEAKPEDLVLTEAHKLEKNEAVVGVCATPGMMEHYKCGACGALFQDAEGKKPLKPEEVVTKGIHDLKAVDIVAPTCEEPGMKAHFQCSLCKLIFADQGGSWNVQAESLVIPAQGHKHETLTWTWAEDYSAASVTAVCACGDEVTEAAQITPEIQAATCTEAGNAVYTATATVDGKNITDVQKFDLRPGHKYEGGVCTVCGDDVNEYNVFRVFGANRYETAFQVADEVKEIRGIEKFDAVVVASGTTFADALAGSYLASEKDAPILLVNIYNVVNVKNYIRENVAKGGTVYLLGGESAISTSMDTGMTGYTVKRLQGANRYETNLAILDAAGLKETAAWAAEDGGTEILVCTGKKFADSLSASALGKPILLVREKLFDSQKAYLESLGSNIRFVVIGGESAVSLALEKELTAYGPVERIGGANRYETSTLLAKRFFQEEQPKSAVLAYAKKFPDGLCGGPLAKSLGAPLILTVTGMESEAADYTTEREITGGYVLGGTGLISDDSAKLIFSAERIKVKK